VSAVPSSNETLYWQPLPASPPPRDWSQDGPPPDRSQEISAAGALLDVSRLVSGLLRLARPDVGTRSERITRLVSYVLQQLEIDRSWEFEVAARFSQIGCLEVTPEVLHAALRGERLAEEDLRVVASHHLAARDLLIEIGRLESVAEMIARQNEPVSVPGKIAVPLLQNDRLALGGQLLRVCGEFDRLLERGAEPAQALETLRALPQEFHPELVVRLEGWDPGAVARRM
jgi:response regulator RpfG family c-di-GMP phosphodiesterase